MLTKKDIKQFTQVNVIVNLKGQEPKFLKNREVYEHSSTEIRIVLPRKYEFLYIKYPTKKDQNGFGAEDGKITCTIGNMRIEFIREELRN